MTETIEKKYSDIIDHLLKSKRLTTQQVTHAERVQAKLATPKPLLHVLKELNMVLDETVEEVIKEAGVSIRIGQLLVDLGHITQEDLEAAFNIKKESEKDLKIGEILEKYKFIDGRLFNKILSIQLGLPMCEPTLANIEREMFAKVPPRIISEYHFLPIKSEQGVPYIAFSDPLDQRSQKIARQYFGTGWRPALADKNLLLETIQFALNESLGKMVDTDTTTVIGIVNSIILAAINDEASDIHLEPMRDRLHVRFREDGVLRHYKDFAFDLIPAITSRIKIMCNADIAERRRHQGGRALFDYAEGQVDMRVSFYVTVHGEKVVLRLLRQKQHLLDIRAVGMLPSVLTRFLEEAVYQPTGVLLVTGPTGSGKTSTVYSCISHIKNPNISIITAEEPVEYVMEGVAQCSIDPSIDRTFKETLRHIVRQDPDVIMIGEIRDHESAEMAMQAALTGHKVLSTFHTEDSIGGLIRLLNMDIAPFLISSTVVSVLAQRLLRKVCTSCAVEVAPTPIQLRRMGLGLEDLHGAKFMKGKGCPHCKQTGYRGRVGVFELLVLNETVRNAILAKNTSYEIRDLSIESSGLITLLEDGIIKAADGTTSIGEVLRCLPKLTKPRPLAELRRLSGVK